ncbi:MAG: bifunctional D-glycero-beta-D-manno-heptose-7-phosphate kinase/D-glycero-beta-D-manno-heptose 1-phosphate adenylyltransferase HldE [Gammaproteobacteria bacterium]|nr:bifunctional D-glycero-beta-D-manno-heptose-7-phosphate kinase/D-glycero-beta-D-manno-heptose 1-phosphate adenylyltransferase HldE [Gammaproteobacteria bacterium]
MLDVENKKIVVIGDVMLDRYWQGDTSRISPEAPVPVVHIEECESRPGGAGNVALNIAALGMGVCLFGLVGNDQPACELIEVLRHSEVDARLVSRSDMDTITKLRIVSRHQQLLRLDHEKDFSLIDHSELLENVLIALDEASLVILSDYNKGTLANICPQIIDRCRQKEIAVVIDPKGNHRLRYQNATLLTPNMSEFQQMVGECSTEQDIEQKGRKLIDDLGLDALLVTRSEKGMTLFSTDRVISIPSRGREVFDVTGAGDSVIAVFSAALASGESFHASALLANRAAGIVVGKLGAATVSLDELKHDPKASVFEQKIVDEGELKAILKPLRSSRQVVMTNGCFDILQPGHVANLEQCKALGDMLIVAVNDDDSVTRLKGAQRPINTLRQRMQVLAGLASVDYVIAFNEDTPERLIGDLLPDVLAKGGDYRIEEIAGATAVLENGGRVETIDLLEGYSSTDIISRIQKLLK